MKYLTPTKAEAKAFRSVVNLARKAGFRVPSVEMRVVDKIKGAHGYAYGNRIVLERRSFGFDLLCHELAHVICAQLLTHDAAHHSRFWALTYGVLYQQCFGR